MKLIKQLKADGCNGLLNLNMSIETLGPSKGENLAKYVCAKVELAVKEVSKDLPTDQRNVLYLALNHLSGSIHNISEKGLPNILLTSEGE